MQIHNVVQGSPEWLALRAEFDATASEVPIIMGANPRCTREELLRMKVLGYDQEHDWFTQQLFEEGHRTEALARPIIERIIGEELYPATGSTVVDGLNLLASYDGLDMAETMNAEHKMWNAKLAAACKAGDPPPLIYWQLEAQQLVGDLDHSLWVVSDGTEENMERMEYRSVPERRAQMIAAIKQFKADRATFKHEPIPAEPVRKVIPPLPLLVLDFEGAVQVKSNVDAFKQVVMARIEAVNMELLTDQDFDDAKADVKFLEEDVEKALGAALAAFLKKNEPVQVVIEAVQELQAKARAKRLPLEKAITTQRANVVAKIREKYLGEWQAHVKSMNASLSEKQDMLPEVPVDIDAAIAKKRNLQSMHDACKQAIATGKLALGDAFTRVSTNMNMFREKAAQHAFLFQDVKAICNMAPEAAAAVVAQRIDAHEKEQQAKRDADAEAEKKKLQTQMAMQEIQGIQQQVAIAISGRLGVRKGGTIECIRETLAETESWTIDDHFGILQGSAQAAKDRAVAEIRALLVAAEAKAAAPQEEAPLPGTRVMSDREWAALPAGDRELPHHMVYGDTSQEQAGQVFERPAPERLAAAAADLKASEPTMNMTKVHEILGFNQITAAFLTELGVGPVDTKRNASLWHERQIIDIIEALGQHLAKVHVEQKQRISPRQRRSS